MLKEWADVLGGWGTWRKHLRSVLVVQDKEGKVREGVARNGWKVTVIADEDGKIGRTLNAFFTPRAYGFEGGKLVWVQKPKRAIKATSVATSPLRRFSEASCLPVTAGCPLASPIVSLSPHLYHPRLGAIFGSYASPLNNMPPNRPFYNLPVRWRSCRLEGLLKQPF